MLKQKRVSIKNDQRGIALITVLIIMLVMTILTTGVVVISVSNLNQTKTTIEHKQSFYVAEAGVNYLVKKLETQIDTMITANAPVSSIMSTIKTWSGTSSAVVHQDLDLENDQSGDFDAFATVDEIAKTVVIKSTGTVNGVTRTLIKTISLGGVSINRAILTEGPLNIKKDDIFSDDSSIFEVGDGEVQTLTNGKGSFIFDKLAQVGTLYIPTPVKPLYEVVPGCENDPQLEFVTGTIEYKCEFSGTDDSEIIIRIDDTGITALPDIVIPVMQTNPLPRKLDKFTYKVHTKKSGTWNENDASISFIDTEGNINIESGAFENEAYLNDYKLVPSYIYSFPDDSDKFYVPNFNVQTTIPGFTIDVGKRNIEIYVDKIKLGGTFNIIGTGKLTVYVNGVENFTYIKNNTVGALVEGTSEEQKVADQFVLVIDGADGSVLTLNGNTIFYLSILTDSNLIFDSGGNLTYNGFLATSGTNVSFTGSSTGNMLLYAPKANVSIAGAVTVSGAIYSSTYNSATEGNKVKIRFDSDYANAPFSFLHPLNNLYYGSTIEE